MLEMLSLIRGMHAMMQAREEREASVSHPSMNAVPTTTTPQPPNNQWESPHVTSGSLSALEFAVMSDEDLHCTSPSYSMPFVDATGRATEPESEPHGTLPAPSNSPVAIITVLEAIRTAVSNLHNAVIRSEEETDRVELGRSTDKHYKSTRFGLKKDQVDRVVYPTKGMCISNCYSF